jgi:hypothetical protein
MPLNLNSKSAIDYSSGTPLFPFEAIGDYVFDILGFEYRPEAHNGECDWATVLVLESSNPAIKPDSKWGVWFSQCATGDKKGFAEAALRKFMAAAVGVEHTPQFDAAAARKSLLESDEKGELEGGGNKIGLKRRSKAGKGKHAGKTFTDDIWSVVE